MDKKQNKIPTAEDFLLEQGLHSMNCIDFDRVVKAIITSNKYHVKAALEAAYREGKVNLNTCEIIDDSILNAYPESLIK